MAFGILLVVFALSPGFLLALALLFLAGVAATVFTTVISTQLQLTSPHELRGRVMSLYAITLIGLPSLGALGVGALAEKLGGLQGAPEAVIISGAVMAAAMLPATPSLWRRDHGGNGNP
jgi:MFS family permease